MSDNYFKARDIDDVVEVVNWALSEEASLEIRGHGSKSALGRPLTTSGTLDLSAFTGITLYEPDELVLSAGVGTPLREIEAVLAAEKQEFAFEPPNFGQLLTGSPNEANGTIGGLIASNLSGPRRIQAGAVRDHILGFTGVNGRGEIFKSGGRVVKNVTGYDLSKVMTGSYGTLAALTSVTVKVLPAGQKQRTVLVHGLSNEQAASAHATAGKGPYYISALAHLPQGLAARSTVDLIREPGTSITALRLEGTARSVEHRTTQLRNLLGAFGATEELHSHRSQSFWRDVRDVAPLLDTGSGQQVWRLSVKPSDGPIVADHILTQTGGEALFDWACGLVWLSLPANENAHHETVRQAVAERGHATLIKADADIRAHVPVFQPQAPGLAMLSKRLKESFDPNAVFNPGRMYEGV